LLLTELGLNLVELVLTPHMGSDHIMFPQAFDVCCWCWGVVILRHARLVLSFVLLVLGVEAFLRWVVTLIVKVVVVEVIREVVIAHGQEVPHGIRIVEPRKVQARIHVIFFLRVHTLRGWSACEQVQC
jgi:hypothetical protein